MKYLCIHHSGLLGGGTLSFFDVIKVILKTDNEVVIALPPGNNAAKKIANSLNVKVLDNNIKTLTFDYYNGSTQLYKSVIKYFIKNKFKKKWIELLEKEKPDVVILNSIVLWPMIPILSKMNIKSICFVRETMKGKKGSLINKIIRANLNNADGVAFLSNFDEKQWDLKGKFKKKVIQDFVDIEKFQNNIYQKNARLQLDLKEDIFYVLFVGGMSKLKGAQIIIDAMNFIDNDKIQLLFLGSSKKELLDMRGVKRLKNLTSIKFVNQMYDNILTHNLSNSIKVIGMQENINYWYSACDVVVFPAVEAHQARPIFEAGVFKKPIIVSDFLNYSEYLKTDVNGLVFKPNHPIDLANKIKVLHSDSILRRRLGEKNYEMTIEQHNWNHIHDLLNEFFKEVNYKE